MVFRKTDECSFTLNIDPAVLTTAQEGLRMRSIKSKSGKVFSMMYKSSLLKREEHMLLDLLPKFKPAFCPIKHDRNTMVNLYINYFYPHLKSEPNWMKEELMFMTSRPDGDNLSKPVVDCMVKSGYFEDDSYLSVKPNKWRSPHPRIEFRFEVWIQERNNTKKEENE